MEWQEGKRKFIQTWGTMGSDWGINRTMAQVHALLMISPGALTAKDIEGELPTLRARSSPVAVRSRET